MSLAIDRHALADVLVLEVDARRHVAAADVEADARDRDMVLVGDHAADRLRIAEVAVGAQHAAGDAADAHAAPHLRDGALVMLAVDFQIRHDTLLSLMLQVDGLRVPHAAQRRKRVNALLVLRCARDMGGWAKVGGLEPPISAA